MVETIKCKLGDIENILSNINNEYYLDEYIVETECEDKILVEGYRIVIPALGYSIRSGLYYSYYEDEEDLFPDFDLSLIYDLDENDPDKYVYWEQDNEITSLHNFLNCIDKSNITVSLINLDCIIELEILEDTNDEETEKAQEA